MAVVDDLLDEVGLVVDHEGVARVVHDHVLGQVEVLDRVIAVVDVLAPEEEEVVVEENHLEDCDEAIVLQRDDLSWILVAAQVFLLKQPNLLQRAHLVCISINLARGEGNYNL